jgi:hypothetical protein
MLEAIASRDLPALRPIVADDGDQARVALRVRKRGEHGHLSDVAEADDGITDRLCCS